MTSKASISRMLGSLLAITVMAAFPAAGSPLSKAAGRAPASKLSLQRIFGNPMHPLGGRIPWGSWRPGREAVVFTRPVISPATAQKKGAMAAPSFALVQIDAQTGTRTVLLRSRDVDIPGPKGTMHHPTLSGAIFAPDGNHVLIPDGDDLYLYGLSTKKLIRLTAGPGPEKIPRFSPDGSKLAYVRKNDLYVYDLASRTEIRLTSDGSPTIHNGILDWVYEEELASRTPYAFAWSKDGKRIAWLRLDDSPIPPFTIVDYLHVHSKVKTQYYPKAGDPSPVPSLHIARLGPNGQVVSRRSVTFTDPIPYVPRFGFLPKDTGFWYQVLNRPENRLTLMTIDFATGVASPLLTETDPYWLEPVDMLHFFPDGRFVWASRRSGWMHLEVHTPGTNTVRDLTPGPWDVTSLLGVDDATGRIWFQAARPTPMERRLYLVNASGGPVKELTPTPGTHSGRLSPSKQHLLVVESTLTKPPHVELFSATGKHLRTVFASRTKELAAIKLGHIRFLTIKADDGTPLNAEMITPPNFDRHNRYPVIVYVYGGPDAQVVRNGWGRSMELFHLWLAQEGFIVFSLDNRGSAGRSRDFEGFIKHRLGSSQLPDQLAGVRWLSKQRYVDPHRIGIWGWSYGGYFTTYALTHAPGVFAAGVAVAPVTDWKLYDSIYTERYMGKPSENPKGYEAGSVLAKVANLKDPLLIIHGTGDDNVHFQNTLQFANAAWRAGTTFSLKLFPNLKHGLRARGSYLQVFSAIGNFFKAHLLR